MQKKKNADIFYKNETNLIIVYPYLKACIFCQLLNSKKIKCVLVNVTLRQFFFFKNYRKSQKYLLSFSYIVSLAILLYFSQNYPEKSHRRCILTFFNICTL